MVTDENDEAKRVEHALPPVGKHVLVQCQGYRCLGFRTDDNQWFEVYTGREIKEVIGFTPLG